MLRGLIEWWAGLATRGQLGIALLFILLSTGLLLVRQIWIGGWVIGGVLLFFTGSSNREA